MLVGLKLTEEGCSEGCTRCQQAAGYLFEKEFLVHVVTIVDAEQNSTGTSLRLISDALYMHIDAILSIVDLRIEKILFQVLSMLF